MNLRLSALTTASGLQACCRCLGSFSNLDSWISGSSALLTMLEGESGGGSGGLHLELANHELLSICAG